MRHAFELYIVHAANEDRPHSCNFCHIDKIFEEEAQSGNGPVIPDSGVYDAAAGLLCRCKIS